MANKIILKKSSVQGKIPLVQDLDYGELALNYADGKLYYKNTLTDVVSLYESVNTATNLAGGAPGAIPYQSNTGTTQYIPIGTAGQLLQTDGSTATWVDVTSLSAGSAGTATNADNVFINAVTPATTYYLGLAETTGDYSPINGDTGLSYNTTDGRLSVPGVLVTTSTNSVSTDSGALIVNGGVGIGGDLYIGGRVYSSAEWILKTSNYNAISGDKIIADTSTATFTITLPFRPLLGASVIIADGAGWGANTLYIGRNGETIEGLSDDIFFDIEKIIVTLVYDGTTWQVFTTSPPSTSGGNLSIENDTLSSQTQYLTMTRNTSGLWNDAYVADSKLYFNPSSGSLSATDFNSLSDITLKENVKPIINGNKILEKINPVSFNWKENGITSYGVIAQEVEKVLPDIVKSGDGGLRTVSYQQLIAFLIDAVKEHQKEIKKIKKKQV